MPDLFMGVDPEQVENNPDIERQWAVKAFHHAETYYNLICAVDPSKLQLTKFDDDLYADFRATFPDVPIDVLREDQDFKSDDMKKKWRSFLKKYEKVEDYNFGTLLRLNSSGGYTEENTMFVEIARNREGLNRNLKK